MFTIDQLVRLVVLVIVIGLIFGLLNYLIDHVRMFEPYRDVARTVLLVAGVLILISILLSLIGYPIVRW